MKKLLYLLALLLVSNFSFSQSYETYVARVGYNGGLFNVIVMENTLSSGAIAWTRSSTGTFKGTLSSAFPVAKTWIVSSDGDAPDKSTRIERLNNNDIYIWSYIGSTLSDTPMIEGTFIEIRVYP